MATEVLSSELARWNGNVNTISISVTEDTPVMEWIWEEGPAAPIVEKAPEKQSFPVSATDVAKTVLFLAERKGVRPITG